MHQDHEHDTPAGLLGLVPVPAAVVDRDDLSMVAVNRPLAQLLGVDASTLVGRSIGELLPPGRARQVIDLANATQDDTRMLDVRLTLGGRDLHGQLTLAPGPTPETLLVVYADHTALHRENSDLRVGLSAVSATAANVSDEMQAELTVVAGYSRMLATAGESITSSERVRLHERIAESAQRAAGLSRELTSGRPADGSDDGSLTDVMGWVEQATALRLADADAVLVWDVDGDVPVDLGVLRQVLVRLVEGTMTRPAGPGPRHVHVAMRPVADGLEVVVTDSTEDDTDELARLTAAPNERPTTKLKAERAMATQVGGWLSSVPASTGTRHVLWLPELD